SARATAIPACSSPWMQPTTITFRGLAGSPDSTATMGRPWTEAPSGTVRRTAAGGGVPPVVVPPDAAQAQGDSNARTPALSHRRLVRMIPSPPGIPGALLPYPGTPAGSPSAGRPHVRDGAARGRHPRVGQAVGVLDGPQHAVMVDLLGIGTRLHGRSGEDGGDLVAGRAVVLVEGDDEQAVVGTRPPDIAVQVVPDPGIPALHRAVVHVVAHVPDHVR